MSDRSELHDSEVLDAAGQLRGSARGAEPRVPLARRRLDAQWAVVATLARSLSHAEATRAVLIAVLGGVDAELASIAVLDGDREETLRVTEVAPERGGGGHRVGERSLPLSASEAIAVAARDVRPLFEDRFPVPFEGLADGAPLRGGATGAPDEASAIAAVPLIAGGHAFGALAVRCRGPRTFDDDERAFVLAVAQQYAEATERARLFDAEHAARGRAEAASRAKSEFLATMSHEIRTPLNAVVGYTDLLELGIAGPVGEGQLAYLERIRASSKHLLAIVNDMLDLSKVEAGRLVISTTEASARTSIDAALAIVHAQAAERSIALLSRVEGDGDVRYCGDARRVEQILLNLLSNALRFTGPGGRVTVTCRVTGSSELPRTSMTAAERWCAIDVEDSGIGIAADHLPTIFDPFMQVDSGFTRAYGGSGLGLAISRRLARAMDGDIAVRSVLGQGSTFTLMLPAPDTAADGAPRPVATRSAGASRGPIGLQEVGDAVLADVDVIVKRYMERLRTDPRTPSAHAMKDTELQDHSAIFVSDIAQALGIAAEADGVKSTLVRHDHDIQNLISDRHGELRQSLGWDASELERDFEIMWEEIEQAVRRAFPPDDAGVEEGLKLLKRFVDRADGMSRRAYRRRAAAAPPQS